MDTFDKVIKAAEKLQPFTFNIVGSGAAFTPLAILWAGYTIAEAIKEAAPKRRPRPMYTLKAVPTEEGDSDNKSTAPES